MRREEANRVRALIEGLPKSAGTTVLNIGSSSSHFREEMQPHINAELFRPLERAGFNFIHCDMKHDVGVDLVGDVLTHEFRQILAAQSARIVICCNILEHLIDPLEFSRACGAIVPPGGFIIVTVPYSYPYHQDPIDTGLRLTPEEISIMFPEFEVVLGEIVSSTTYLQDACRSKGEFQLLLRNLAKVLWPVYRPRHWRARAHRFFWLFRPYKVSVAVLKRPAPHIS